MFNFVCGLLLGAALSIAGVVAYAKAIDATPVYESGFADGFAAGSEPSTDSELQALYGGDGY